MLSVYYPLSYSYDYNLAWIDLESQTARLAQQVDRLGQVQPAVQQEIANATTADEAREANVKKLAIIQEAFRHQDTTQELRANVAKLRYKGTVAKWLQIVSFAGTVIGLTLIIVGMVFWYRKVQKYQDAVLRSEADAVMPKPRVIA